MNDVEEIKARLNIADIVGNYVKLVPAGANQRALCPFHNEKTPSFMVNEERQIFHCFGCGKGGDVFTFIQEIEGMNFRDTLKFLADKAGVSLTAYDGKKGEDRSKIRDIMKEAVLIFEENLNSPNGKEAREYLKERGVAGKFIKKFSLGFALDNWQDLTNKLKSKGFNWEEIKRSGLALENEKKPGELHDRFRGRIMFPILSPFGEPVGFSGRVLPSDKTEMGKYINTPQTELYDKSRALYGINLAKNEIKKKSTCIILEGNLDVVMSHVAGVENAVAACGTAVTAEQIKTIQRYSNNIAFAFDADEAGVKAAKKGVDLALSLGANVGAINLAKAGTEIKDVADIVQKSPAKWKEMSQKIKPAMEYYFDVILKDKNMGDPDEKREVVEEIIEKIALFPNKINQAHYLDKLADISGVKSEICYDILGEKIEKIRNKQQEESYRNRDEGVENKQENEQIKHQTSTALDKLLNRIVGLIVFYPKLATGETAERIKFILEDLEESDVEKIIKTILRSEARFSDPNKYLGLFEDGDLKVKAARLIMIAEMAFKAYNEKKSGIIFSPREDLDFCLDNLEREALKKEMEIISAKIREAEAREDEKTVKKLIAEYSNLTKNKKNKKSSR